MAEKKKEAKKVEAKKAAKPVKEPKKEKAEKPAPEPVKEAPKEEKPVEAPKKVEKKLSFSFKIFNRWEPNVVVADMGLRRYINLKPILIPFSQGRTIGKQFWKSEKHIVERLILRMMVTGHRGKKHYHSSGHHTGKYTTTSKLVKEAFEIIEQKTKKNPIQVLVEALERGSPKEGVTTIEYGGVRYPKAVDLSPQRRIDLTIRWMCQGAYHAKAGRGKKQSTAQALADQIMLAAAGDQKANAVQKSFELERQAHASR